MALLELHKLDIGYRTGGRCRVVLAQAEATLAPGELIALTGRNGSGKSTLLRTLAALQAPLAGTVTVDGTELHRLSPTDVARRIGLVTTEPVQLTFTTVRDLVAYGRLPYTNALGRATAADLAKADQAIRLAGLEALAQRRIATLSDGERQRAMIAKILAQETEVLLLDEPTAFLDYEGREDLMQLLRTLARENKKSILLSTHDLDLARRYVDGFWRVAEGKLSVESNS
jgi:iron complex transport system ATP-binding protein